MSSRPKRGWLLLLLAPWAIEIMALCMVVFQESFRLESRTAHRVLPIPRGIQDLYYFNFGDFSNGFINAFIIDGIAATVLIPAVRKRLAAVPSPITIAGIATLLSVLIVVVFETAQNAFNFVDLADIPAGIAGALAYFAVRIVALRARHSEW
jgi:hypothetical protein